MTTYYDILGVGPDATPQELKKAKQRAQKKAHPDRGGTHQAMVAVNRAYDTLSDPLKKAYYDLNGEDRPAQDSREVQALQLIYSIILQLSDQVEEDFDFVGAVRENLIRNRQSIKDSEVKFRRALRKTERQRTKIRHKKKDGENLLARVFDQKVAQLKAKIDSIPEGIAMADECLKILEDYEYAGERNPGAGMQSRGSPLMRLFEEAARNRGMDFKW